MKYDAKLVLFAWLLLAAAPSHAGMKKMTLYRNQRLGFCLSIPADWRGPSEVANHPGARFGAPHAPVAITIAALSNQPRSTILQQPDAGSEMASLEDYRGATLKEWLSDRKLEDVKQEVEEPTTVDQVPALHTILTYTAMGQKRRYEAVFALWNQTQYSIQYDAPPDMAKHYEKTFQDVIRTFQFQCGMNQQR